MKSKDVKVKARIAKLLLSFCFVAWGVTWVYAFIADEWGLIAGFFKGLVLGGCFAVIPASYAIYSLTQTKLPTFKIVLGISLTWLLIVCSLYLV